MRAVQITEFGGPEVLTVVDVPEPEAGPAAQRSQFAASVDAGTTGTITPQADR